MIIWWARRGETYSVLVRLSSFRNETTSPTSEGQPRASEDAPRLGHSSRTSPWWPTDVVYMTGLTRKLTDGTGVSLADNGWALCPAWFPKVPQAAQHVIYVAIRAPARP